MYTFTLFGLLGGIDWKRFIITSPYELLINALLNNNITITKRQTMKILFRTRGRKKKIMYGVHLLFLTIFLIAVCRSILHYRMQNGAGFLSDLAKLIFNGLNVVGVIFFFFIIFGRSRIPLFFFFVIVFWSHFHQIFFPALLSYNQTHRIGFRSPFTLSVHCLPIENVNWFLIYFSSVCWFPVIEVE